MTHTMVLVETHEGTEEWNCPICGRTFLIEWDPWRKIVITPGDETAQHAGSKGGLSMGTVDVSQE